MAGGHLVSLRRQLEHQYEIQIIQWHDQKDVARVQTLKHGDLCLKPFQFPAEDVQFIADVQTHLQRSGFLYSPRMFVTRHGHSWLKYNNHRYILTNWIAGQSPSYKRHSQLRKSVRTLAVFHQYAQNLGTVCMPAARDRIHTLEQRFQEADACIAENRSRVRESRAFRALCDEALRHLRTAAAQRAIFAEATTKALVHGDFNYPNLIVDEQGHHQLIDFENTSHYVRMEDLAHIIHRNHPWELDGTKRVMEVYNHVRAISQDDLRLLVALLCEPYPLIRTLRQRRFSDVREMPRATRLEQYARGLDEWV